MKTKTFPNNCRFNRRRSREVSFPFFARAAPASPPLGCPGTDPHRDRQGRRFDDVRRGDDRAGRTTGKHHWHHHQRRWDLYPGRPTQGCRPDGSQYRIQAKRRGGLGRGVISFGVARPRLLPARGDRRHRTGNRSRAEKSGQCGRHGERGPAFRGSGAEPRPAAAG